MPEEKMDKKILVVDDEEMIIDLIDNYFSSIGYGVSVATTAEDAINQLNNGNKFNLVLTDINLPGKSGLDLLKIINETKNDLPVVLLTGLKTLDTAISALQSGAVDYITKPFDLGTIQKVVERALRKQSRSQKKEKVFEYLKHLRMDFKFKTFELDAGILARELSGVLEKMQFSDDDEVKQYELVFTETLINAIEHGNLELSSSKKSNDILRIAEFEELKEERLQDPQFGNRHITVSFECNPELFSFTVKDEGPGFDWQQFLDKSNRISSVNLDSHGRGFMIIRHIIDEVHFNKTGNVITLIKNSPNAEYI